ncbi:MAG: SDR family oxidoreductase [Deltaproteobacteria bacterium]|nr:SDR family oxidoreductase [Deltaproteobacteria bacterium]MBW2361783.1 SDR family oxidoreductase [Deltaproteobacteria bacterium]
MGALEGKVAIVTGAGRGLGRGISLALAKEGASIGIAEIDAATGQSTAAEIAALGVGSLAVECDVRDRSKVESTVEAVASQFGGVDILVNNATGARQEDAFRSMLEHTPEQFERQLQVDVLGSFHFMRACHPHLRASGAGRVINLSSSAGTERGAGFAAYSAAKEALRALTGVTAREWGRDAITVNSLCPVAVTDAMEEWFRRNPEIAEKQLESVSLGRHGDPERDIGRVVVFLCGPDAGFITGQTLWVDGGSVIHA